MDGSASFGTVRTLAVHQTSKGWKPLLRPPVAAVRAQTTASTGDWLSESELDTAERLSLLRMEPPAT